MSLSEKLQKADTTTLQEVLREAESRLDAQLTTALASDQRAMNFFGYTAAISVASFGAALASVSSDWKLSVIGFVVGIGFAIASVWAFEAAEPIDFQMVGNDPDQWVGDIEAGTPFNESLAGQISHYDEMLKDNRKAMGKNGDTLKQSAYAAKVGVALAGVMTALYFILLFAEHLHNAA